jgi:hypothetical protein
MHCKTAGLLSLAEVLFSDVIYTSHGTGHRTEISMEIGISQMLDARRWPPLPNQPQPKGERSRLHRVNPMESRKFLRLPASAPWSQLC